MYTCVLSTLLPSLPPSSLQMLRLKGKNRLHPNPIYHMVDFLDTLVLRLGIVEVKEAIMTKDHAVEAHSCIAQQVSFCMTKDVGGLFFKWVASTHTHAHTHTP